MLIALDILFNVNTQTIITIKGLCITGFTCITTRLSPTNGQGIHWTSQGWHRLCTGCQVGVFQIAFSAPGSLLMQAGNPPTPHAQDTFSCGGREESARDEKMADVIWFVSSCRWDSTEAHQDTGNGSVLPSLPSQHSKSILETDFSIYLSFLHPQKIALFWQPSTSL